MNSSVNLPTGDGATALAPREEIRFGERGCQKAAWHYKASNTQAPVCIVMAHGFGATRYYGLAAFAERFQADGFDCLVFDYRHFGDSDGEPRGLLSVKKQHEDWADAVAHARKLGYLRIVLWGTSFSGGHVLHMATKLDAIAAVISQVPHIDGPATAAEVPLGSTLRIAALGMTDALMRLIGHRVFVKAFAPVGELAAMATSGVYDSMIRTMEHNLPSTKDGQTWKAYFDANNRVTALSLLAMSFYSPGRHVERIKCPVLIQAGRNDKTTPFEPAMVAASHIANCQFLAYDVDHFDPYLGRQFEITVGDQLNFLRRLFPECALQSLPRETTP